MYFTFQDFYNTLPLTIIGAGILLAIVIEIYSNKSEQILPWFSVIIYLLAASHSLATIFTREIYFNGMLGVGGNVHIFYAIFNIAGIIIALLSIDYIKKYGMYYGEYYILLMISILGMMFMASARDLFMVFLGLEVMSICFYAMAGLNRRLLKANESSLKYFLLGSFATGFLVYGVALIYGASNTTSFDVLRQNISSLTTNIMFLTGLLMLLIGLSFKIAAFPFHMWVPDVYQGTSTTVAGIFSTGGKAAAFSALVVIFSQVFGGSLNSFMPYLAIISVLSMFYGAIVAIAQTDIKRMLAYSSISHAGYIIIGLAASNNDGIAGVVFYLIAYTFMNLGAFGIVALVEGKNEENLTLSSYAGLSNKKPVYAALLAILMFALAGLPPFSGFFSKYYIFIAAVKSGLTWLAVLGVLSSTISVYFYIRIIVLMYFRDSEKDFDIHKSPIGLAAVIIAVIFVIALGIMPGDVLALITSNL
ncbi:MAG TPA: NADH-quinone oxidoreductase subunit N [Ignavibacteriaceae bacterium]|nr:NADH-quinone oxidoreductase subunit N [Ignavibacteriaceae bacterium]